MQNSHRQPDTIVAIASPPGRGAVGVIRISGATTADIAMSLWGHIPPPRVATLRNICSADGITLDAVLVLYFPAPASFTGETVMELQGHGGTVVQGEIVTRIVALGARLARPGEFTERAFLNGKLDLAQAEAVADLIDAGSTAAARAAMRSLQGAFSARIADLQVQLTSLRVQVEAAIDFPDEELDLLSSAGFKQRLAAVLATFDSITVAARQGALLREGVNVVIAGKPNAGKSSLINRLAGEDVAIVTPVAGTTRDVLRQSVNLDGLQIHLSDTAGLRAAVDSIEAEGIRRAWVEIARADHVLFVSDATLNSTTAPPEIGSLPPGVALTWVRNKIDLLGETARRDEQGGVSCIHLSAQSGNGIDLLRTHLKAVAGFRDSESGAVSARRRHLDALARAAAAVRHAADDATSASMLELYAEDLRVAQNALSEISGEFSSDDLLGEIFSRFCIGK